MTAGSCSAKSATNCSPCAKSSSTAATASVTRTTYRSMASSRMTGMRVACGYWAARRSSARRDRLADLIGRDVAAVARAAPAASPMVVDLFAGSGNTLSWIKRHTGARRAIGFELDNVVFELASKNLSASRAWALT